MRTVPLPLLSIFQALAFSLCPTLSLAPLFIPFLALSCSSIFLSSANLRSSLSLSLSYSQPVPLFKEQALSSNLSPVTTILT